jgi:putative two-component system response regulator
MRRPLRRCAPLDTPATQDAPSAAADVSRAKIMIVDDEPIAIKVVQKHLQEIGCNSFVTTTESKHALEMIHREMPDLVLLDIMMPDINGLELLRRIRSVGPFQYLPIIIVTAHAEPSVKREALDSGATDFLAKPVDPNELAPRVRNVLAAKAYQDHLAGYAERLEREVRERTEELLAMRQRLRSAR